MSELADTVVFEVDHPDSQHQKRDRVDALAPCAREIRFVPVDFTTGDLDGALEAAGHDRSRPTAWVWEGVVMYLTPAAVEATLAIVARRSAAASHLALVYISPALAYLVIGFFLRRLGEPLRSSFSPVEMRALLTRHGFSVLTDADLHTIAGTLSSALAATTRPMRHQRVAVAARGP
jgi:methyltransferase (TIGR00027 family)